MAGYIINLSWTSHFGGKGQLLVTLPRDYYEGYPNDHVPSCGCGAKIIRNFICLLLNFASSVFGSETSVLCQSWFIVQISPDIIPARASPLHYKEQTGPAAAAPIRP